MLNTLSHYPLLSPLTALLDRDMSPSEVAELGPDGTLTPAQVESVVVDEIAGVLWRLVYLKKEELAEEHVLEFARWGFCACTSSVKRQQRWFAS